AIAGCDAGEDHVLLGGQPDLRSKLLHDPAKPAARSHAVDVRDASVLDEDAQVKEPIALLVPAEVVVDRLPGQMLRRLELERHATLNLLSKPVEAAVRDRVLEPRMAPVRAVAVVALHRHDLARQVDDLVRLDEAERHSGRHERLRLVVRSPEASTNENVETAKASVGRAHRDD